jgi:hypothetical protein
MRLLGLVVVLTFTFVARVGAQDSVRTWGFTSARVDSYTAAFVYAGYGYRGVFGVGGVMYNQRSKYSELVGGVGLRRRVGGARYGGTHFLVATVAKASDSRYAQLYYLPSARLAGLEIDATLEAYAPLDDAGEVQYYVTPLSAFRAISRTVAIGASYELAYQRGLDPSQFLGPTLRVSLPAAQLSVDVHGGIDNAPGKLRFSFKSSY